MITNIKKFIPQPIRTKLRPYKNRLQKIWLKYHLNVCYQPKIHVNDPQLKEKMQSFSEKYGKNYFHAVLENGWSNPGHMFDELGEIFSINQKLFFVGCQKDIERITKKLEFIGCEIESMCISKPSQKDIAWIAEHTSYGYTVVIAYEDSTLANLVAENIIQYGAHFFNVNIFIEFDFIGDYVTGPEVYCGIFAVYTTGKVYLIHNNMLTTTVCNLNCEHCLNYTPYDKHPKHFSIDELKKSADIYFSHIDRVGLFQLSGGEPMLYPHIKDIIEYISKNYRDKIGILNIVINGTIIPNDDFIEFCKKENIFIYLDDYTESVPRIRSSFMKTLKKLEESGVMHCHLKVDKFFISFPPLRVNLKLGEIELQRKFRNCYIGVQNLRDGKLRSCTYHAFAVNAGLIPDAAENWFDMAQMTDDILDKRKLIEFRLRFNQKGYVDWCRYCNGHISINSLRAPAARQAKGRLTWDRNNPTFLDNEGADSHAE